MFQSISYKLVNLPRNADIKKFVIIVEQICKLRKKEVSLCYMSTFQRRILYSYISVVFHRIQYKYHFFSTNHRFPILFTVFLPMTTLYEYYMTWLYFWQSFPFPCMSNSIFFFFYNFPNKNIDVAKFSMKNLIVLWLRTYYNPVPTIKSAVETFGCKMK